MKKGKGILWFVYICVLGLGFSRTTASLTRMMGLSVSAYFLLTAALVTAVLLLIYLPGKLLAGKFGKRGRLRGLRQAKRQDGFCRIRLGSWALLALLMGALAAVRLFMAPDAGFGLGQPAYEQAISGGPLTQLSLSRLYVWLLSFAVSFFPEGEAVLACNLILQMAGAFFVFFGIHLLAGALCAAVSLVCVIAMPVFHNSAFMAEPQNLLLFLSGLLVWFGALCIRAACRMQDKKAGLLPVIGAGFVCGAFGAVSLQLVSLLFLLAAALLRKGEGGRRNRGRLFAGFIVSAVIAFFLLLWLNGMWCGIGPVQAARQWLFAGISREYDALLHSPGLTDYWLAVPVYLLAFLAVFGILDRERENGEAWILPLVFVTMTEFAGAAPLQEQGMRFLFLGVMAGYGMLQATAKTESAQEAAEAGNRTAADIPKEVPEAERKTASDTSKEASAAAHRTAAAAAKEVEVVKEERQTEKLQSASREPSGENSAAAQKPGVWLDNPLPVPKRHVKKEMNYAFDPDPDQMFFDIPTSEQDDFDI